MDGLHLTADLRGCDARLDVMIDEGALGALCVDAVQRVGLKPVGQMFHRFAPESGGVTGVVLLAESHLAIHTWPELGAVTLDVYVCNVGRDNSDRARLLRDLLLEAFNPAVVERRQLRRGGLPSSDEAAAAPAASPSVKASSKTE
jgi:S-adenosylmethionine decarboxylase